MLGKKYSSKWELIGDITHRMKIFSGWLVIRDRVQTEGQWENRSVALSSSMVYVPDPKHEWKLKEMPNDDT